MTDTKHTPTPWKVTKYNNAWTVRQNGEGVGVPVAEIWDTVYSSESNAAHIVKCVNLHDELVEALKKAEAALSDIGDSEGDPMDEDYSIEWCEKRAFKSLPIIREALKKAGAL